MIRAQAELREVPPALQAMLTKYRAAYQSAIRAIRWGEGPIYALASPGRIAAALAVRHAFEDLLGWTVEVREASSFAATSSSLTPKTGSVVIILIAEGLPDAGQLSNALTQRGAQVLAVTAGEELRSRTAGLVLRLPRPQGISNGGPAEACLEHAGVGFMALVAARLLKRPSRPLERREREWGALPRHFERIVDQAGDAVRSFVARLGAASDVIVAGEGPYYAVALRAASFLAPCGRALDLAGLGSESLAGLSRDSAVVFVSGSHCKAKRAVAELAAQVEQRGLTVLALTDSNDRALIRSAQLSLLMPDAGEAVGPVLALGVAAWVACEADARGLRSGWRDGHKGNRGSGEATD